MLMVTVQLSTTSNNGTMEDIKKCAITLFDHQVIDVKELERICPAFFIGCVKSLHKVVQKQNIRKEAYFTGVLESGVFKPCHPNSGQKKTFIKISYLEDKLVFVPVAPPKIELEDDEFLRDNDGNVLPVEVRGERHYLRSFFSASDVGDAFDRNHFIVSMISENSSYREGEDYVKMIVPERKTTEWFLTYTGFMRAIHNTRSDTARKYVLWSAKIVCTHHMGTKEQKQKLAAKMIGIPVDVLEQFSGKIYIGGMPGVYIFMIGTVKELRNKYDLAADIPEDYLLLKFGRTISIERRTKEHKRAFRTPTKRPVYEDEEEHFADITELTQDPTISLVHYAHIDPRNIVAAERMIKEALKGKLITFQNRTEIIAIPRSELPLIEALFLRVKQECSGGIEVLEAAVTEEKNKRIRFEEKCELLQDGLNMAKTMLEEQKKQNTFIQSLVKGGGGQ